MRVDYQRLRPFRKLLALPWRSENDYWNGQLNPLTASLPQPLFCVSELLVAHRTLDCIPILESSYSLRFNPQFQSFKLLLCHTLQSHRCGQMQGWNVLHFVAEFYLATEFLYFRVSAHFQKHFIRIGNGQRLFNQAMLNQNAMIRRYCQRRWMALRSALVLFWVFHCAMARSQVRGANLNLGMARLWHDCSRTSRTFPPN